MGKINHKTFETEDPQNPGYSLTEYDLYAKLGMTIRKNHTSNRYEIVKIKSGEVQYSGNLEMIVRTANDLEGDENTWISE